jgi:hypothetical protein
MKTYKWSVHDKDGKEIHSDQIILEDTVVLKDIVQEISKKFDLNIGSFHEFRVKEI